MGTAPTGGRITLSGIHVMRVEGGKVVEHWGQQDSLGFMQQLGAIPAASGG